MPKNEIDKINGSGKSLRELVYTDFCEQMQVGKLSSGNYVDQSEICKELHISKAPLRDALIQLETEGFVSILPRKGVVINSLTLQDIINCYGVLAVLESEAVRLAFDKIEEYHLERMELLNEELYRVLECGNYAEYYRLNIEFHNVFLNLGGNDLLQKIITPIKQRLYDFPLRDYNIEWEESNTEEHERLILCLRKKNREAAANIIKYEHWSFKHHENYIRAFYQL